MRPTQDWQGCDEHRLLPCVGAPASAKYRPAVLKSGRGKCSSEHACNHPQCEVSQRDCRPCCRWDASQIYGTSEEVATSLRVGGDKCEMRLDANGLMPLGSDGLPESGAAARPHGSSAMPLTSCLQLACSRPALAPVSCPMRQVCTDGIRMPMLRTTARTGEKCDSTSQSC